jgi:hypothetical protein
MPREDYVAACVFTKNRNCKQQHCDYTLSRYMGNDFVSNGAKKQHFSLKEEDYFPPTVSC